MVAVKPALASAPKAEKSKAPKVRSVLERLMDRAGEALKWQKEIAAYAAAWEARLVNAEGGPAPTSLDHLVQLGRDKYTLPLAQAHEVLKTLVEARWNPPEVKASGSAGYVVGDRVQFRDYYLEWGTKRGVFTAEEVSHLEVVRVQKDKQKEGAQWVTVACAKTKTHYGPVEDSKLKARA